MTQRQYNPLTFNLVKTVLLLLQASGLVKLTGKAYFTSFHQFRLDIDRATANYFIDNECLLNAIALLLQASGFVKLTRKASLV